MNTTPAACNSWPIRGPAGPSQAGSHAAATVLIRTRGGFLFNSSIFPVLHKPQLTRNKAAPSNGAFISAKHAAPSTAAAPIQEPTEIRAAEHSAQLCCAPTTAHPSLQALAKQPPPSFLPPTLFPRSDPCVAQQQPPCERRAAHPPRPSTWAALCLQRSQGQQQSGVPAPLTFLENICFHYQYCF